LKFEESHVTCSRTKKISRWCG